MVDIFPPPELILCFLYIPNPAGLTWKFWIICFPLDIYQILGEYIEYSNVCWYSHIPSQSNPWSLIISQRNVSKNVCQKSVWKWTKYGRFFPSLDTIRSVATKLDIWLLWEGLSERMGQNIATSWCKIRIKTPVQNILSQYKNIKDMEMQVQYSIFNISSQYAKY